MSAGTAPHRTRRSAPASQASNGENSTETPNPDSPGWIGVDVARLPSNRPPRALLPLVVLALIVALGIASLRIDLIRTRYALAEAMADEEKLIAEQHKLIVQNRQLRDPVDLAVLARESGFRPAEAVLTMPDPTLSNRTLPASSASNRSALPNVAAGPIASAAVGEPPPGMRTP